MLRFEAECVAVNERGSTLSHPDTIFTVPGQLRLGELYTIAVEGPGIDDADNDAPSGEVGDASDLVG